MSENKPLKCQKCGRPIGYIEVTVKSVFQKSSTDNVRLVGTCMDCHSETGFARRNLNNNLTIPM